MRCDAVINERQKRCEVFRDVWKMLLFYAAMTEDRTWSYLHSSVSDLLRILNYVKCVADHRPHHG
jgi:hypothetical protein